MTGAAKVMNPQRYRWDLANVRIRINPAIQIRIPDHFWLKFWHWQRFAVSEYSLVIVIIIYVYKIQQMKMKSDSSFSENENYVKVQN